MSYAVNQSYLTGNYEQFLELKAAKLAGEEASMANDLKKLQVEEEWRWL